MLYKSYLWENLNILGTKIVQEAKIYAAVWQGFHVGNMLYLCAELILLFNVRTLAKDSTGLSLLPPYELGYFHTAVFKIRSITHTEE